MLSRTFRTQARRVISTISFLTLAAACGGSDDGMSPGTLTTTFSATVTGGSAGSYSGFSSAVQSAGLFGIGLTSADGKFALAFTRSGARPAAGSYSLGIDPRVAFSGTLTVGGGAGGAASVVYSSTSGTLTITESSSAGIKGTFSFTGAESSGRGTAANVSGTFDAVCTTGC
jgi:hypothetical protein